MTTPIDARCERARQLSEAGRLDDAVAELQIALRQAPSHAAALEGLAYISVRQGAFEAAADAFDRLLASGGPMTAQTLFDAAFTHISAVRHDRADALFEQAVARSPDPLGTLHAAGMAWAQAGDNARALNWFERTLRAAPNLWQGHFNRGRALGGLERYDDEIEAYRRAHALAPQQADPLVNLGVALRDRHQFADALQCFRKAIQADANHPGARTNRAQTNLMIGEFEHGWREYEWRWLDGEQQRRFTDRLWDGRAPLAGKTVFVYNEQGFGDTLQFLRFVPRLVERGANVILSVQTPLVTLLGGFAKGVTVIGESMTPPAFDWQIPLLSLPNALGTKGEIGMPMPYVRTSAAREAEWRTWLASQDTPDATTGKRPLRVGFAWRTRPFPPNRTVPLAQWQALLGRDAIFVALQADASDDERAMLAGMPSVRDATPRLNDFAETAALIMQLDLVISVDTAVLHLAGALGKPAWALLMHTPDWRWLMQRRDSDWYPSLTLFRQPSRGEWPAVMAEAAQALDALIAQREA